MKPTIDLIVALATLPLILSACGGGSGGGSSATIPAAPAPQTINGISVPPEPDPVANNATLAGVDSNGNGVRDDVERKIAAKLNTQSDFELGNKYAIARSKIINSPVPKTRADALAIISSEVCLLEGAPRAVRALGLNEALFNSAARKEAERKFNDVLIGYSPEELLPCK
jgi:hypothetical protein